MNEKITSTYTKILNVTEEPPSLITTYDTLYSVLRDLGLLDERVFQELESGKEYWQLERMLCSAVAEGQTVLEKVLTRLVNISSYIYLKRMYFEHLS
jgi:hypothetical protein